MKKILLPLAALGLLCACTQSYTGNTDTPSSAASSWMMSSESMLPSSSSSMWSSSSMSSSSISGGAQTFTDSTRQYSIQYPANFKVVSNDNLTTEDYSVTGTSFTFPPSFASGNTLSEAKINVAVQPTCPSLSGGSMSSAKTNVTINGVTYDTNEWSGVGAGNLYQGTTYSTVHDNSCYLITLYMHSCNLGPDCYAGHTTPFDKKPLVNVLNDMVQTFKFL